MNESKTDNVKVAKITFDGYTRIMFRCPGCKNAYHQVSDEIFDFNMNFTRPTIRPSILVTYNGLNAGVDGAPPSICHSFVTDGSIEYCGDSTHELSGKSVAIPDWDGI